MNAMIDSHLHVGSLQRIGDLRRYMDLLGLEAVGALSLPLAGVPGIGDASTRGGSRGGRGHQRPGIGASFRSAGGFPTTTVRPNFNPEVLAAMCACPGRVFGYGSFDNRALLASSEWRPDAQVEEMHAAGFFGVKMWEGKPDLLAALGITLDDPRLVAAYRVAGERGMPVLIHVADPRQFWYPHRLRSEAERGAAVPPWSYADAGVPAFDDLIDQAGRACTAAPGTTFVFPHLLFLADDLPRLEAFLDEHPNALVDLAPGNYLYPALGAVGETADPRASVDFFARYRDRILAGSDSFFLALPGGDRESMVPGLPGTPLTDNLERFLRLRRFLESDGAMASPFALTAGAHPMVRGLALDRATLEAVFSGTFAALRRRRGLDGGPDLAAVRDYLRNWADDDGALVAHARHADAWITEDRTT